MTSLTKLPRGDRWEVDLLHPDPAMGFADLAWAMLVVVESDTGRLRAVELLTDRDDITPALLKVARSPRPPARPERPREVRVRPGARADLAGAVAALGARLRTAKQLPEVDRATESLLAALGMAGPTLLPAQPGAWPMVLRELVERAPWDALPDRVTVRMPGAHGPAGRAVAIVLGLAGEQYGLSIFPSDQEYRRFLAWVQGGGQGMPGTTCWCVHLDDLDELDPQHVARARELGLVVGGKALNLFAVQGQEMAPLDPALEPVCLAFCQAVVGAWSVHGPRMAADPTQTRHITVLGPVGVTTDPGFDPTPVVSSGPHPLVACDHQLFLGSMSRDGRTWPLLALKMAKRDAQRLAADLAGVDGLSFQTLRDGRVLVSVWMAGVRLSTLTVVDAGLVDKAGWDRAGGGALVVSAGGARRGGLSSRHVVMELQVQVVDPSSTASTDAPQAEKNPDPVFPGAWDGPLDTWPKASSVLLEFAAPLGLDDLDEDQLEMAADYAAAIWSAVVANDHEGDDSLLREVRRAMAGASHSRLMAEALIERKRQYFAKDSRTMAVESCRRVPGRIDLRVMWRPVDGG